MTRRGHAFSRDGVAEVDLSPEEVWAAIATGPGIDSWFLGRNEVEPGPDGVVRLSFADYSPAQPITAWEPGRRLAYEDRDVDGRFVAHEFLLEGRAGGGTVIRVVTSGFLPGDDWAEELEAVQRGGDLFFATLVQYLTHFAGRTATPLTVFGPPVTDWDRTWAAVGGALGLDGPAECDAEVRLDVAGLEPATGVVYHADARTVGVRVPGAMLRFFRGFRTPALICGHHLFDGPHRLDEHDVVAAWSGWLRHVTR